MTECYRNGLDHIISGTDGMIVTVLRSRIRAETREAYDACTAKMRELVQSQPGFISVKAYYAEDGEKVAIHECESAEHLRAWREHPEHVEVQQRGRDEFYEDYTVYVCDQPRVSRFSR
jgi:heme-degrading monooxygenase HmoA